MLSDLYDGVERNESLEQNAALYALSVVDGNAAARGNHFYLFGQNPLQFCHLVGTHIAFFQFLVGFLHDFGDQFFPGN